MGAYVLTTIGTLVCSVGATFYAAGGRSPNIAAILAAMATIFVGTEKSLLFREKWKFHLLMYTKLHVLRTKFLLGRLSADEASDEYAGIITLYASEPTYGRTRTTLKTAPFRGCQGQLWGMSRQLIALARLGLPRD
jgi:hypothetical protein